VTAFLWALLVLVTLGLAAPFLFSYAARRANRRGWYVVAALYALLAWGGVVLAVVSEDDSEARTLAGFMILSAWFAGTVHAWAVRRDLDQIVASPAKRAFERARDTVDDRRKAQEMAAKDPAVALEAGVGRPDVRGAIHMGVVDVNHAAFAAIAGLPSVDDDLAHQIVHAREEVDGFASVEDMGMALHLDGDLVEDLRPYVVFLPR
jgi:hypothetical protein